MGNALQINGLAIQLEEDSFEWDGVLSANGGRLVSRASAVMAASPETLFTVTGLCAIMAVIGRVEVAVEAQATTVKLQTDPTGAPAVQDLCGTVDLNAAAVGTLIGITGVKGDAAIIGTGGLYCLRPIIVQGGIITGVYGDVSTGELSWKIVYTPLSSDGAIVAA